MAASIVLTIVYRVQSKLLAAACVRQPPMAPGGFAADLGVATPINAATMLRYCGESASPRQPAHGTVALPPRDVPPALTPSASTASFSPPSMRSGSSVFGSGISVVSVDGNHKVLLW